MSDILTRINKSQNRPRWVKFIDDHEPDIDSGELTVLSGIGAGFSGIVVAFIMSAIFRSDQENFPTEFFFGWFAGVAIPLFFVITMLYVVLPNIISYRYHLRDVSPKKTNAVNEYNNLKSAQQETIRTAFEDLLQTDDNDEDRLKCAYDIFRNTLEALKKQDKLNFELERLQPRESEHILQSVESVNNELLKQVNEYKELTR